MKDNRLKEIYDNIGRIILLHRLRLKLSQFNFGIEVGLSSNQVGRIERSESNPTVETLVNICHYIGISEDVLFRKFNSKEIQEIEKEINHLKKNRIK